MIKEALVKTFPKMYSLMEKSYFYYMRREKNSVIMPVADDSFKWNCDSIKTLIGQGKVCCELNGELQRNFVVHLIKF